MEGAGGGRPYPSVAPPLPDGGTVGCATRPRRVVLDPAATVALPGPARDARRLAEAVPHVLLAAYAVLPAEVVRRAGHGAGVFHWRLLGWGGDAVRGRGRTPISANLFLRQYSKYSDN